MGFEVIRPGLFSTVQDLGRFGYQKYGVVVSGAMDPFSFRLANLLVGNQEGCAALEITMVGPKLRFDNDHLICICGGDLQPMIDNQFLPLWRPIWVKAGSVLKFGKATSGCRSYLAIAGGMDVPTVMGSKSTYLRAAIGGLEGRSLQAGDYITVHSLSMGSQEWLKVLSISSYDQPFKAVSWSIAESLLAPYRPTKPIVRIIHGPHYELFSEESQIKLYNEPFFVSPQSDRMGYRLSGPQLQLVEPTECISEAVSIGTIQVPPSGDPILLMADRQTTGGYPKIGYVASVDLPIMAQLKPGDRFHFSEVSLYEAQSLLLKRENKLKILKLQLARLAERGRLGQ